MYFTILFLDVPQAIPLRYGIISDGLPQQDRMSTPREGQGEPWSAKLHNRRGFDIDGTIENDG